MSGEIWSGSATIPDRSVEKARIAARVLERTKYLVGGGDSKVEHEKHRILAQMIDFAIVMELPAGNRYSEDAVVKRAVLYLERVFRPRRVGRHEHSKKERYKEWYREQGGRRGLGMGTIQDLMKQADGSVPDPKTIRKWEKEVDGE